jgi:hypothetical protein
MWYKNYYVKSDFMSVVIYAKDYKAIHRCHTIAQAYYYIDHIV